MHPAAIAVFRAAASLLGAVAIVALVALLAACGGGGDSCHNETAAPAARPLSFAAPVGVLPGTAAAPSAPAEVSATTTVTISGAGGHSVFLRLTSARPGQPAVAIGSPVEVKAGQPTVVTLAGRLQPGAQTVSIAFSLVGVSAEGETLTASESTFSFCETTPTI